MDGGGVVILALATAASPKDLPGDANSSMTREMKPPIPAAFNAGTRLECADCNTDTAPASTIWCVRLDANVAAVPPDDVNSPLKPHANAAASCGDHIFITEISHRKSHHSA